MRRDARMAWLREARFGMFIHWGLYAVPAGIWNGKSVQDGTGEWIMNYARIPVAQYRTLAKQFNPTGFDANAWVALAVKAGMKYIVITAKHHDGFALFDSKADAFNVTAATPFRRDPLKELAAACERQDIKLGFYYSQDLDWTAPGWGNIFEKWDAAQNGNFAEYLESKAIPQLQELLTNYQPHPAIIWFDYPTKNMTPELASKVVTLLNRHPNLIWNNRLGGGYAGDTETPEQHMPAQGYPGKDWEMCMTINDTWGYKSNDRNFKSAETLLRNLIDIASKGGNYLLNVGPDAAGVIPQAEADRLAEIGKWMAVNGEAIYGSGPTPFAEAHGYPDRASLDEKGFPIWVPMWDWRCTTKPGRIFIHFFQWPGPAFTLTGVMRAVTNAYLLAERGTPLKVTQSGNKLTVALPAQAPDPIASVLVLEVSEVNGPRLFPGA